MKAKGGQGVFLEKEGQLEDQALLDYGVNLEWLDQMDLQDL